MADKRRLPLSTTKYHWIALTFIGTLALDCVSMKTNNGTFYEEIYTLNKSQLQRSQNHLLPHKYFHTCSINSQCNFVVKDLKNQLKLYNTRSEIPSKENLLSIWMKRRGKIEYKVIMERHTWHKARNICQSYLGDLASILDKQEEDNIRKLISGLTYEGDNKSFWLGLNDINIEGTFVWSDGSNFSYANWGSTEPNNGGSGEDCTITRRSLMWFDAPCGATVYIICKIPLV